MQSQEYLTLRCFVFLHHRGSSLLLVSQLLSFRQFDGLSLLLLVEKELSRAGLKLVAVQFVACVEPLDSAAPSAAATLWVMRGDQGFVIAAQGTMVCHIAQITI